MTRRKRDTDRAPSQAPVVLIDYIGPLLLGAAGAGALSVALGFLEGSRALEAHALVLVVAGTVYFGAALSDGRRSAQVVEAIATGVFLALALVGLWISPIVLAGGWLLHGGWDLFHHSFSEPIRPSFLASAEVQASWYPMACLSFDAVLAMLIVVRYL